MNALATYDVLLVEDDPSDTLLLQHAFASSAPHVTLHAVRDGVEAITYLSGEGSFKERTRHPVPSLILLDLKLPKKSGLEVLAWIRKQPALAHTRVIVLTSSQAASDIDRAYDLGASSYLVKKVDVGELRRIAEGIETYVTLMHQKKRRA